MYNSTDWSRCNLNTFDNVELISGCYGLLSTKLVFMEVLLWPISWRHVPRALPSPSAGLFCVKLFRLCKIYFYLVSWILFIILRNDVISRRKFFLNLLTDKEQLIIQAVPEVQGSKIPLFLKKILIWGFYRIIGSPHLHNQKIIS